MLRKASELKNYRLAARDGEIGRVKDFFFDDQHWTVRYLVADTMTWLTGRRVLISPAALGPVHEDAKNLEVRLTKEQIEQSPRMEEDEPVSRQHEVAYWRHYGWPMYWQGPMLWGAAPYPGPYLAGQDAADPLDPGSQMEGDPHLRSVNEVTGYYFHATDGDIGHVEEFILDDSDWAIRYVVLDTRNWWPGKKVLLAPAWIGTVDWANSKVHLNVTRETIQRAPAFDPDTAITRDYEEQLHRYYAREGYWRRHDAAEVR
jgi:hypothetical protein